MQELRGKLFVYDAQNDLKAYSNGVESSVKVVFVGGLGCNLPIDSFTTALSEYCKDNTYEFIIPQLRSHPHFGLFTLDDDAEDIDCLVRHVGGDIVLVGNSTGCQDILHYLNTRKPSIRLAILQGAVSDVEYEEHTNSSLGEQLARARKMDPDVAIRRRGCWMTMGRFMDLFSRNGKEDMFSSYLDDSFFASLNATDTDILFVISGKDEYGVADIQSKLGLVRNSRVGVVPNGTHVLTDEQDIKLFLSICNEEIRRVLSS